MDASAIEKFLDDQSTGVLATIDRDGYPYITPMHFVLHEGTVFVHGRAHGEKISNITANPKVGFEVDMVGGILPSAERACGTNSVFKSVVIRGTATIVEDADLKKTILNAFVEKYVPQHKGAAFGEQALKNTAVIEIKASSLSSKQHPPAK